MSRSKLHLIKPSLLLLGLSAALAGCGTSAPHRMGTGAASGAATGAAFGLIGGPIGVVIGGAIGGGIGALTASTTTPQQINLDNVGKTGTGPAAAPSQPNTAYAQPGLRNQINSYQSQPQSLTTAAPPAGYGQSVQAQPLPPPNTQ
ncbi:MAG: hypothetical protein B7Z58_05730 [Acidiphilium sp. 37-64-53]|uniref:hypothetical protein n=1 Tax=Acidiphilium TaxID=522 RepID=UPI000BCC7044|nr:MULTISPECIES: hypothetical protein [Acidiphilium]OYW02882.1 MAG: hypothetical protein B7Z58_05730 [Acidiphilium sp. 37-64-53]OZB28772.1 MAG: hypothetical protein B7X49_09670 [Acidiphilium sp. 34-64-41]HQT84695.1 hypothetical protein [Acidiphilium rubrum]